MPMIGRRFTPGMKRAAWGAMQSGDFPVPVLHLKFGENTGDVVYDSSPEGNDGDISGASWVKGYLGPGLSFDKIDDYVSVADDASIQNLAEWTIVAWIYPKSTGEAAAGRIIDKAAQWLFWVLGLNSLQIKRYCDIAAADSRSGTRVITLNKWNQVVATFLNKVISIYVNGKEVAYITQITGVGALTTDAGALYIGNKADKSRTFDGFIDEFRIYDVALTARQIKELYLGME